MDWIDYFISLLNRLPETPAFILSLEWVRLEWWWLVFLLPFIGFWLARKLTIFGKWSSWVKEPMLSLLVANKQISSFSPFFLFLFVCIISIALLGPAKNIQNDSLQKSKTPLFIVLDLSLSMLSEDISPNRLEFAKYRIIDMLRKQKDGLISLVVYSGSAHIVTPLTEDIETIIFQLPKLNPEIMPNYGSNPIEAFTLIEKSLQQLGNPSGRILWLTDEATNQDISNAQAIAQSNLQELVILAIGTEDGSTIPLSTGPLYDANNNLAISKAPLSTMQLSAVQNSVRYYLAEQLNASLLLNLSTKFDLQKKQQQLKQNEQVKQWHELGYWLNIPLLLLLIFLMRSRIL